MTDTVAPSRFERPSAVSFLGYAGGLILIVWCLAGAGFSVSTPSQDKSCGKGRNAPGRM